MSFINSEAELLPPNQPDRKVGFFCARTSNPSAQKKRDEPCCKAPLAFTTLSVEKLAKRLNLYYASIPELSFYLCGVNFL